MKNLLLSTLLLASGCLLSSCKQDDPETKQLKKYLQQKLNLSLPEQRSYFVLIPANQCPNCINYDGNLLSPALADKTYIISGLDSLHFRNFNHYYYDTANYLVKLRIVDYSNKIFVVQKKKIIAIIPCTNMFTQLDSLDKQNAL